MIKRELYQVEGSKLVRQRRFCPRCGPGIFLAEHSDRFSCGKCGYTEFKKESKAKQVKTKVPVESVVQEKTEPVKEEAKPAKEGASKQAKPKAASPKAKPKKADGE